MRALEGSMRLLFAPDAAQTLASLPYPDAMKLFARLVVAAGTPAGRHPWARRLTVIVRGRRVSHGPWRALCRRSATGETVVDRLAKVDVPNDAADMAILVAAEVDELTLGRDLTRAGHRSADQVQLLLSRP